MSLWWRRQLDGGSFAWSPANLTKPTNGAWFKFGSAAAVDSKITVSSGKITGVQDSFGSGKQLTAPANSNVVYGTDDSSGRAYAGMRAANVSSGVYPCLTGTNISPTASQQPFTLAIMVTFKALPTTGAGDFGSFCQMGGTVGAGTSLAVILGSDAVTNIVRGLWAGGGTDVGATFGQRQISGSALTTGTYYLANGSTSTTIPSKQLLVYTFDGTNEYLWINGMRVAVVGTYKPTPPNANFIIGRYFNAHGPPDHDVFEALVLDYCITDAQQKLYAQYAARTYGIPATAPMHVAIGDSIERGYNSTHLYNDTLPVFMAASPYNTKINVDNEAITSTHAYDWLSISPTSGSYTSWMSDTYARGIDPLSTLQSAAFNFGINDINGGTNPPAATRLAAWQANMTAIGQKFASWGCKIILGETIIPMDATALGTLFGSPNFATERANFNNWMRNSAIAAGAVTHVLDWDDTTNSDSIPGVQAWAPNTTYNAPAGTPPYLVSYGGNLYFCKVGGTSGASGGPTADSGITWVSLGAGTTIGALPGMLQSTHARYSTDHLHLGTDLAVGDCGSAIYMAKKAYVYGKAASLI